MRLHQDCGFPGRGWDKAEDETEWERLLTVGRLLVHEEGLVHDGRRRNEGDPAAALAASPDVLGHEPARRVALRLKLGQAADQERRPPSLGVRVDELEVGEVLGDLHGAVPGDAVPLASLRQTRPRERLDALHRASRDEGVAGELGSTAFGRFAEPDVHDAVRDVARVLRHARLWAPAGLERGNVHELAALPVRPAVVPAQQLTVADVAEREGAGFVSAPVLNAVDDTPVGAVQHEGLTEEGDGELVTVRVELVLKRHRPPLVEDLGRLVVGFLRLFGLLGCVHPFGSGHRVVTEPVARALRDGYHHERLLGVDDLGVLEPRRGSPHLQHGIPVPEWHVLLPGAGRVRRGVETLGGHLGAGLLGEDDRGRDERTAGFENATDLFEPARGFGPAVDTRRGVHRREGVVVEGQVADVCADHGGVLGARVG